MLSALLMAGLFGAPIATGILFLPLGWGGRRSDDPARWFGRLALALGWAALVIAAVIGILALIGATRANLEAAATGLGIACILWLPVTRRWGGRAHVCWALSTYLFAMYLVFMLSWTFASHLGVAGTIGGMLLWVLELVAALLGCTYLWELCDTLGRAAWMRRIGTAELAELPEGRYPFVCLQVPCYNEPPDMVIETLTALRSLDYPNYEIQVLDDNTDDEALWRPVEAWCRKHDVKFVHLSDWPGYKSGALNYALRKMVDSSCELIGVIDSDYQIEPQFLRRCVPLFIDPRVGFIQAPQDYRDWQSAPFYRRLYYSYKYFFTVSQPSRNERDGAIFAGTMGLIRRRALEQVGGWDEWCITEDAELSLRLLRVGWSGLHVDPSFGKGIMPLTFEALKGQRFRWCFGGIQILRRHWRSMLPGPQTPDNRLSLGQRWTYLSGALQWYGDLLALLFFIFLLIGAANNALSAGLLFRKLDGFLLGAIPLLVVLGLLRAVALLRRGTGASWRDALGAFLIWQSTALTVASASLQALYAKEAVFLRTPKTAEDPRWSDAVKANAGECVLAALGLAGIAGSLIHGSGLRERPARGAARLAHAELPGRPVQQPERSACGTVAGTRGASADRAPSLRTAPAHVRRGRARSRGWHGSGRARTVRSGSCERRHAAVARPDTWTSRAVRRDSAPAVVTGARSQRTRIPARPAISSAREAEALQRFDLDDAWNDQRDEVWHHQHNDVSSDKHGDADEYDDDHDPDSHKSNSDDEHADPDDRHANPDDKHADPDDDTVCGDGVGHDDQYPVVTCRPVDRLSSCWRWWPA
jgi:glycosyltransferase involved in cell wall biosynthesis